MSRTKKTKRSPQTIRDAGPDDPIFSRGYMIFVNPPGLIPRAHASCFANAGDAAVRPPAERLVFRKRLAGAGWCFARAGEAEYVDRIRYALEKARTWGALRSLLPNGEFETLALWFENGGESLYHDGEQYLFAGAAEPEALIADEVVEVVHASDPFEASRLPGVCDGDYPPFLDPEQDRFLPEEFCRRWGARRHSMVSGSWWEFPPERVEEMKAQLEASGFSVTIEIPKREEVL